MCFRDGYETFTIEEKGEYANVVIGTKNDEHLSYPLTLREAKKVVDFLEKFIQRSVKNVGSV